MIKYKYVKLDFLFCRFNMEGGPHPLTQGFETHTKIILVFRIDFACNPKVGREHPRRGRQPSAARADERVEPGVKERGEPDGGAAAAQTWMKLELKK